MRGILTSAVSAIGLVGNGLCAGACLAYGGPLTGWGLMFLLLGSVNTYALMMRIAKA